MLFIASQDDWFVGIIAMDNVHIQCVYPTSPLHLDEVVIAYRLSQKRLGGVDDRGPDDRGFIATEAEKRKTIQEFHHI